MPDLLIKRRAEFSVCGKYRYYLEAIWDHRRANIAFLMLNPSVANAEKNDPTVERCQRRARVLGYGGLIVLNMFALVSTDPAALYTCDDPVGPNTDDWIHAVARCPADKVTFLCGWGRHAEKVRPGRAAAVLGILQSYGHVPLALGVNDDSSCQHPLYIGYDVRPAPYVGPT